MLPFSRSQHGPEGGVDFCPILIDSLCWWRCILSPQQGCRLVITREQAHSLLKNANEQKPRKTAGKLPKWSSPRIKLSGGWGALTANGNSCSQICETGSFRILRETSILSGEHHSIPVSFCPHVESRSPEHHHSCIYSSGTHRVLGRREA
ncbi:hypothetical protein BKA81DRAFT_180672 [Phyllosticta paracitricarpa]